MNLLNTIISNAKIDGFSDNDRNELIRKDILDLHKSNLIVTDIKLKVWNVDYEYMTKRNNKKQKQIKLITTYDKDTGYVKLKVLEDISRFNKNNQYRAILNVKILNVSEYIDFIID